jgi:putative glutamine amidotransferase
LARGEPVPQNIGAVQHCHSVERIGAEPLLLRNDMDPRTLIRDLALDGLIFSGGGDIAPATYGGNEVLGQWDVDPQRDSFEFALMEKAIGVGIPVLATCRGMEVANVVLGGTLIEDLRQHLGQQYAVLHHQVDDSGLPFDAYAHEVTVIPDTLLDKIVGLGRFKVNSIHHQAIAKLGHGLRSAAQAEDGVIEAIEFTNPSGFFVGVLWHPEWLPEDVVSRRLYARLLDEARSSGGFRDAWRHGDQ